ncbi:protealysin inhibitor emfourin [Nostoc sp. NIES-2111]
MRVFLERTGGFAGISKSINVDTNQLSQQEAEELSRLVAAADLFRLPAQMISSHPQIDRFQYQITIEDNGQRHTVTANEAALPNSLKTLVEWLNQAPSS